VHQINRQRLLIGATISRFAGVRQPFLSFRRDIQGKARDIEQVWVAKLVT
jgi:hypothetical protein